jgi:putative chitinase
MSDIKLDKLKGQIPDSVLSQIPDTINKFQINTPLRLAHFLAQCGHESGHFKVVQENLNYSVDGLKKIFPKYFPENLSESYAKKPEKIASKVYANRMGNGSEETKEGYKFRGRGYIQLTGKDNYKAFGTAINEDIVSNPDLVATKYPLLSAAWFFSKNCLKKCDAGSTNEVITSVTKCVNGGTIGLADRIKEFNKFYSLLV